MMAVTFKRQDGVNEVFQHARASEVAVFSHVPNEDNGDVASLGDGRQELGRGAYLRYRTRC